MPWPCRGDIPNGKTVLHFDLSAYNGTLHLREVRQKLKNEFRAVMLKRNCILMNARKANISPEDLEDITFNLPERQFKCIKPADHPKGEMTRRTSEQLANQTS